MADVDMAPFSRGVENEIRKIKEERERAKKPFTNYDVYFGTPERALDSLSMLLEFPDHRRAEVRDFQKEVREVGVSQWIRMECTNQRWWAGVPLERR